MDTVTEETAAFASGQVNDLLPLGDWVRHHSHRGPFGKNFNYSERSVVLRPEPVRGRVLALDNSGWLLTTCGMR